MYSSTNSHCNPSHRRPITYANIRKAPDSRATAGTATERAITLSTILFIKFISKDTQARLPQAAKHSHTTDVWTASVTTYSPNIRLANQRHCLGPADVMATSTQPPRYLSSPRHAGLRLLLSPTSRYRYSAWHTLPPLLGRQGLLHVQQVIYVLSCLLWHHC